ncbi:hypothetical protein NQ318_018161 [Aromia moschata]|uniref:Uncharacterized protein n=1 Tax=Aromia moschata TaxID=1265417 RepID=A0AAV8ZCT3_9CUCU|nr:hypothetical protein NQ318_018161 [Aromia moschata]
MQAFVWIALCAQGVMSQSRHNQYASILEDTRNEPTPDGHFGYLYKTEDGIVSSARGDPSGVIHGTFSYTDPTGLKVNYNYNAGSRFTPGLGFKKGRVSDAAPAPTASKYYKDQAPTSSRYREPEPNYDPQYYR